MTKMPIQIEINGEVFTEYGMDGKPADCAHCIYYNNNYERCNITENNKEDDCPIL